MYGNEWLKTKENTMSKMGFINYLCENNDQEGLLEEVGTQEDVNYWMNKHKQGKIIEEINMYNSKKMVVVNSYISSYNRGNLEYKGVAYRRMMKLIDVFFSSALMKSNLLNKINHKEAMKKEEKDNDSNNK
tara:strand:- start:2594 stop:2986 length:393 start_codon:yes stop_codon:yes gene_type:complete